MTSPTQPITEALVDQLRARAAVGLEKYGVTLDRQDVDLEGWLQHMLGELLDGAGYAMAAMRKVRGLRSDELTSALIDLIDAVENTVDIPEPCCNCASAPPCSDCVQWSLLRETLSAAKAEIAMPKAAAPQPAAVKQDLTASERAQVIARLREVYNALRETEHYGIGKDCGRMADGLSANPQPEAKAGADHSGCCGTPAYCSSVQRCTAHDETRAQPTPAEGGAVAWITDQPIVCNGGITRDKRIADAWKDNGWNVTALAPAAATCAEEAERYAIHWAERDAQGVVSIHRASPNDWPDWVHRKQPGPDFPKRERWEDRASSLGEALLAEKPVPKCLRCGALTDLVCGSAECGNRNPSAMNPEK